MKGLRLTKKNKILAHGFGAIGMLISAKLKGKEFANIPYSDIQIIEMKKYKLNEKACYVTLKDNTEYIFKFSKPEQTIEGLNAAFKASKKAYL